MRDSPPPAWKIAVISDRHAGAQYLATDLGHALLTGHLAGAV